MKNHYSTTRAGNSTPTAQLPWRRLELLLAAACLPAAGPGSLHAAELRVDVDLSKPLGTMRGGIGASLHAIEKPMLVTPGGQLWLISRMGVIKDGVPPPAGSAIRRRSEA